MLWSDLAGQERAVSTLRRAIAEDRLHHAFLFHGPEGIGKKTAARLFAQVLQCASAAGPCGVCSACRRIAASTHPDVLEVGLEVSESTGRPRQEIVIEQVRGLGRFLAFRPLEGRRRIAIVDPADRMNPAAANAFLKTLEEPPGASVIVLIAINAATLLETIRSRCRPVRFVPLPAERVEELLRRAGAEEKDARLAAALTGGAPGKAMRLLMPAGQPEGRSGVTETSVLSVFRERRGRVLDALLETSSGSGGPGTRVIRAAESFSPKNAEEFLACFELAEALLRDALIVSAGGGTPAASADEPERIGRLARSLGEQRAAAAVAAAGRIRGDFRMNVNRQLAAESLLMELVTPPPAVSAPQEGPPAERAPSRAPRSTGTAGGE